MIHLLDVNVLLALFDPAHEHFERVHQWFSGGKPWASCPITVNGFIRIASSSAYPGFVGAAHDLGVRLAQFQCRSDHRFWHDSVNLLDESRFQLRRLPSARHSTDIYLLGLAAAHDACLATCDTKIPHEAVVGGREALESIP